jgi:hypothetical protein
VKRKYLLSSEDTLSTLGLLLHVRASSRRGKGKKKKSRIIVRMLAPYGILFFSLFGLDWVMPSRVVDLFACGRGQFGSVHSAALWKMFLSCIL